MLPSGSCRVFFISSSISEVLRARSGIVGCFLFSSCCRSGFFVHSTWCGPLVGKIPLVVVVVVEGALRARVGIFFVFFFLFKFLKTTPPPPPPPPYGFDFDKKPRREKGLEFHFCCSDCAPLVVAVLLHVLTRAMGPMHVH